MGFGECAASIVLLTSVVKWHQKIRKCVEDASVLAVHALDLLCNQGNNSSLVVSVETFETHFTSDFCLLEQQSARDSVAVKYRGRVGGGVYLLFRGLPPRSVQGSLNTPAALHVGCLASSMGACAPSSQEHSCRRKCWHS